MLFINYSSQYRNICKDKPRSKNIKKFFKYLASMATLTKSVPITLGIEIFDTLHNTITASVGTLFSNII